MRDANEPDPDPDPEGVDDGIPLFFVPNGRRCCCCGCCGG